MKMFQFLKGKMQQRRGIKSPLKFKKPRIVRRKQAFAPKNKIKIVKRLTKFLAGFQ